MFNTPAKSYRNNLNRWWVSSCSKRFFFFWGGRLLFIGAPCVVYFNTS